MDNAHLVRELRWSMGLTQRELARILGVHERTPSHWERRTRPVPKQAVMLIRALSAGYATAKLYEELTNRL